jgi:hypothetical protein
MNYFHKGHKASNALWTIRQDEECEVVMQLGTKKWNVCAMSIVQLCYCGSSSLVNGLQQPFVIMVVGINDISIFNMYYHNFAIMIQLILWNGL